MKRLVQLHLILLFTFAVLHHTHASSPGEKVICSHPGERTNWLPEAKIREIFGEKDFIQVKFKISGGNCYEFYAIHKDGSIVEAYYHPVSGQVMRYNRVEAKSGSVPAKPTPKTH